MIGIEWTVPAALTTAAGTLNFNTYPGLILDPKSCSAKKDVRAPKDNVPQGDGDIIHHRFLTGYEYTLVANVFESQDQPACDDDLRTVLEDLGQHLTAMQNTAGRYCWIPTNYGDTRALDEARWFTGVEQTMGDGGIVQVRFSIDSPFPYVIDLTQISTSITAGGTVSITNAGNVPFYPVLQAFGPASGADWSIFNNTTNQGIFYDETLPGAVVLGVGDYAEIDTYRGTIFENGDGADMVAGIEQQLSDIDDAFTLVPGANSISANNVDVIVLSNNAWA